METIFKIVDVLALTGVLLLMATILAVFVYMVWTGPVEAKLLGLVLAGCVWLLIRCQTGAI